MKIRILMSPDSTEGGGETTVQQTTPPGGIPGASQEKVDVEIPAEKTEETEATEETEESTGLTREDITAILQEVIPATQQQQSQQQEPPRQWTQEETDRYFNVWKPDEVLVQRLRHEDPKVALEAL